VHVSLVIPAYNEENRIGHTLATVRDYFAGQDYDGEIIVVDDGSRDGTSAVVRESFPDVRLLSYEPNRGKGHAVRTGMLAAAGAFRVFYDADASTPIGELEKLWPEFDAGADIVIGSRALPDSEVLVHQSWWRENMGRAFNRLLRLCRLTRFPDTQCGFKGFTAAAAERVFPRQTITGFGFDAELLYIAQRRGLRVRQVPVRWADCPHTRLNAATDSLRMFRDVLAIRLRAWRGRYG